MIFDKHPLVESCVEPVETRRRSAAISRPACKQIYFLKIAGFDMLFAKNHFDRLSAAAQSYSTSEAYSLFE